MEQSRQIILQAQKPLSPAYPKELKKLGDHLRKKRLDLKLLQKEVAQRLGVSKDTICNWENNRTSPALRFMPRIMDFLGYLPYDAQGETLGEWIVATRRLLGLSQEALARRLGVDPSTLGSWERGEHRPLRRHLEKLASVLTSPSGGPTIEG